MKKWIFLLGAALMLTGCSTSVIVSDTVVEITSVALASDMNLGYGHEEGLYINEDMANVIGEINDLNDKYKKDIDERDFDNLYIDIYSNNRWTKDINFSNSHIYGEEHFKEIVQILDRTVAEGLEDYIMEMKNKDLKINETIIEKIGRSTIYVEDRGGNEENYINIAVRFLDVKDEYYRNIFNQIANEKYIIDNLITGEKLNLMEFVNLNNTYYGYSLTDLDIRYNMFFQGDEIEKVNILIQRKEEASFKDEDMEVFINLLNSLELKEEEKDLLVSEYKSLLEEKVKNKKIDLDNYKLLINATKGNVYSGRGKDLIYFSIERH